MRIIISLAFAFMAMFQTVAAQTDNAQRAKIFHQNQEYHKAVMLFFQTPDALQQTGAENFVFYASLSACNIFGAEPLGLALLEHLKKQSLTADQRSSVEGNISSCRPKALSRLALRQNRNPCGGLNPNCAQTAQLEQKFKRLREALPQDVDPELLRQIALLEDDALAVAAYNDTVEPVVTFFGLDPNSETFEKRVVELTNMNVEMRERIIDNNMATRAELGDSPSLVRERL